MANHSAVLRRKSAYPDQLPRMAIIKWYYGWCLEDLLGSAHLDNLTKRKSQGICDHRHRNMLVLLRMMSMFNRTDGRRDVRDPEGLIMKGNQEGGKHIPRVSVGCHTFRPRSLSATRNSRDTVPGSLVQGRENQLS